MKNFSWVMVVTLVALIALSGAAVVKSRIHGEIVPPESAKKVWAINGKDTLSINPVMGHFSFDIAPGTWKLYIEAMPPYRPFVKENIQVKESEEVDLGKIVLVTE